MTSVSFSEIQRYSLWHNYAGSSRSYRPTSVKIINQKMTNKEYVKSRIHMAGTILLGPEKSLSILYSVTPRDDRFLPKERQCIHSTMTLFAKHCGFRGVGYNINNNKDTQSRAGYGEVEKVACRNAALGMCQCKKEDWRPFKHGVLNFVLSPYED
nr:asparaginyl endopeptidase 1 [Tanacetum cinerariifolium]